MDTTLERTQSNLDFDLLASDVIDSFGNTTIYKTWTAIKARALSHDPVAVDLVDMVRGGQIQLSDLIDDVANSEEPPKRAERPNGGLHSAGTERYSRYQKPQRREAPARESRK